MKSPRSMRSSDWPSRPGKPATNSSACARARATAVVISGMCATAAPLNDSSAASRFETASPSTTDIATRSR